MLLIVVVMIHCFAAQLYQRLCRSFNDHKYAHNSYQITSKRAQQFVLLSDVFVSILSCGVVPVRAGKV